MDCQFVNAFFNDFRCSKGIGPRLQIDTDVHTGVAVEVDTEFIGTFPDFSCGQIRQADNAMNTVGFDDNVGKLLRRQKLTRRCNGVVKLLFFNGRRGPDSTYAALCILCTNCFVNILHRYAQQSHFFGVYPYAHRRLGIAEDADIPNAGKTFQFIDNVEIGVVGQFGDFHAPVRRPECHHEQVFFRSFADVDSLISDNIR
ncbi:hypothetical protein EVA_04220 [gut metagenome]|uniref:Uncharacterized protein n=1 Tax=gut metagenome TaxID=749906 RepID=J9GJ46_9ZZZZ